MFPFRACLSLIALCAILLAACAGDDSIPSSGSNAPADGPVTVVEKPPGLPEAAQTIDETLALGQIERQANQPPIATETRRLEETSCEDAVMVFQTSVETIYAARSCDGFWDAESKQLFLGKEVAIVLEVTDERLRVLVETLEGDQAQFTVDGIWLE